MYLPYTHMNIPDIIIMHRDTHINDRHSNILPPPIIINKEIEEKLLDDIYEQDRSSEDCCKYDCCDLLLCACILS